LLLTGILSVYFILEFGRETEINEINESICEEVIDEKDRSRCFYDLAIINNDENFCGRIKDSNVKDECYYKIAFDKNDPRLCGKIKDIKLKLKCDNLISAEEGINLYRINDELNPLNPKLRNQN
jgi:hypothetical protein